MMRVYRRTILSLGAALFAVPGLVLPARGQTAITVPLEQPVRAVALGSGGVEPIVRADSGRAWLPTGAATDRFQPASYMEWRVSCTTPGYYAIALTLNQTDDPVTVLCFETRPDTSASEPTRYASPDTKDYGTTPPNPDGQHWRFIDLGNVVDAAGRTITVPLWRGDNILRVQNVTGRHEPARRIPPEVCDPRARPWGAVWSNVHIGSITLTRVGGLPPIWRVTGRVTADRPAGLPVRRALVTANPPGASPPEPSGFRKNGWYTLTAEDGTYDLRIPLGTHEIKAGRPDSYQAQGSPSRTVDLTLDGIPNVDLTLASLFEDDGSGVLAACIQAEYFETASGGVALVPESGQNGYRLGWVDPGERVTLLVDAPRTGLYRAVSSYANGGETGTVRLSSDGGSTATAIQPASGWDTLDRADFSAPLLLAAGPNRLTLSLSSGASDMDAVELRLLPEAPNAGWVRGTVRDWATGLPVEGAVVTLAGRAVRSGVDGSYSVLCEPGEGHTLTVSHPFAEASAVEMVPVVVGAVTRQDIALSIRPHRAIGTEQGYAWMLLANTGSEADYRSPSASEAGFRPATVPGNWDTALDNDADGVYGWYRLRLSVPQDLRGLPATGPLIFRIPGPGPTVCDVDAVFWDGFLVGATGSFPDGPRPRVTSGYRWPQPTPYDEGLGIAPASERAYVIPAGMLAPGEHVLAVRVYNHAGPGGIVATPYLEAPPAPSTVSGRVLAGTYGVPDVRVCAMGADGLSSDWTLTDATGAFTLHAVRPGSTFIGAARPGYTPASSCLGTLSPGTGITGLAMRTMPLAGRSAAEYDGFGGVSPAWRERWMAVSLSEPGAEVLVAQPGRSVHAGGAEMPGTVTVEGGGHAHGALVTRQRFRREASVTAARLVSALPSAPEPDGIQPNAALRLCGAPGEDPGAPGWLEVAAEGYAARDGQTRIRYVVRTDALLPGGEGDGLLLSAGAAPAPHGSLGDVSSGTPLDAVIARTGSFYDVFLNGVRVFSGNVPKPGMRDHRAALLSAAPDGATTWDWLQAAPAAPAGWNRGDLNRNGFLDADDARQALRRAAGLDAATASDIGIGDVSGGDFALSLPDALRILQAAWGSSL